MICRGEDYVSKRVPKKCALSEGTQRVNPHAIPYHSIRHFHLSPLCRLQYCNLPTVPMSKKFAEYRALRAQGKTRLSTYEVQEEEKLYEELDEEDYKKVVRDRLNQDDFVIDDNGEGYVDDGREDWTNGRRSDSESEEELPLKGKAGEPTSGGFAARSAVLTLLPSP